MKLLIGKEEIPSVTGREADVVSPASGKVVWKVALGNEEDFEKAARTAAEAAPIWNAVPLYRRIEIIYRFVSILRERSEEIVEAMVSEGGKAINEARAEVDCAGNVFCGFAEAARNAFGNTMPLNADPRTENDILLTIRDPLGVVAAVLPFNFPVELFAHKVAPALLMGNAVLVKPATYTPRSAYLMVKMLLEAGVTPGAINYVTGSGREFGLWMSKTNLVDAVSFTGSTAVGVELMQNGARSLRRTYLELGGNDPFVVFADCDLDLAVAEASGGRLWNAGQTCCACKRFIVDNKIRKEFTEKLVRAVTEASMGDPALETTVVGPLVSEKEAKNAEKQIEEVISAGGRLLCGGHRKGAFIEPTVIDNITPEMAVANDMEIFAPVFPIIGFDTFEEAVAISNQTSYGLAAAVISENMKTALRFADRVKAGMCVINGSGNYRSMQQPFGGYKHSGIGREGTADTLKEFSQQKAVILKKVLDR